MDSQKVQTVRKVKEKKNPSELAKYLLDNYEFAQAKTFCEETPFEKMDVICLSKGNKQKTKINKVIEPPKDLALKQIFLSSNENYLGAFGKTKFVVYETKNGQLLHTQVLPSISDHEFLATHQTLDSFECSSENASQRLDFESQVD